VPNLGEVFGALPNIIRNNARHELDFASVNVKSVEDADVDAYGNWRGVDGRLIATEMVK